MFLILPDDRDQYTDEATDIDTESIAFALYMSTEADVVNPSLRSWDQAHPFLRNQRRAQARALVKQLADMGLVVSAMEGDTR